MPAKCERRPWYSADSNRQVNTTSGWPIGDAASSLGQYLEPRGIAVCPAPQSTSNLEVFRVFFDLRLIDPHTLELPDFDLPRLAVIFRDVGIGEQ